MRSLDRLGMTNEGTGVNRKAPGSGDRRFPGRLGMTSEGTGVKRKAPGSGDRRSLDRLGMTGGRPGRNGRLRAAVTGDPPAGSG